MGKVYLTGAGPGDIELLTIKALKVIQEADVVIYDRLVNQEILKRVKDECKLIYVGKTGGYHTLPQEQINEIIYENALEFDTVVRLKGGDPLVFGRGGEEAKYLKSRGIEYEFIPGVTSAISVPAYAGIPVTHRGLAASFRVVTGHETPNKKDSWIDWETMKADETIIFLMGLHNLNNIVKNLMQVGHSSNTPCAVISKGTIPEQKTVVGTLLNIVKLVEDAKLETPALIVVGKVVKLRDELRWFTEN